MTMLQKLHLPGRHPQKPEPAAEAAAATATTTATAAAADVPPPPSYDDSQQQWAQHQGIDDPRSALIAFSQLLPALGDLDLGRSAGVLRHLTDTPCSGRSNGSSSTTTTTGSSSKQPAETYTYSDRIRQHTQLPTISKRARTKARDVCNRAGKTEETLLLALSALVLTEYYAGLGNRDEGGRAKTQLRDVAACGESGCRCVDYDCPPRAVESIGGRADWWTFGETSTPKCCCGHPAHLHRSRGRESPLESEPASSSYKGPPEPSSSAAGHRRGVQEMLLRYCGAEREQYRALLHCAGDGNYKTQLGQITPCGSEGCPCADYDRAPRGVHSHQACVCSHAELAHVAQEVDQTAVWDLSWILVEACYDRLDQLYSRSLLNIIM